MGGGSEQRTFRTMKGLGNMLVNLDRDDLISLAKGTMPNYSVMNHPKIKKHGYMGGPHGDEWKWKWNAFENCTDEEIWEIYQLCKNSWKND